MKSKVAVYLIAIAAVASPVTAFAQHGQAAKADRHAVRHAHNSSTRAVVMPRNLPTASATTTPAMKPTIPAKPK